MYQAVLVVCVVAWSRRAGALVTCDRAQLPLELGDWSPGLTHLDSAVVENKPVYATEGQVYVYENVFQRYTIRYINVDNLALRTCGASADVRRGGVGQDGLLVVLSARPADEIRSVIDVWGTRDPAPLTPPPLPPTDARVISTLKSKYLFKDVRAFGHNKLPERDDTKHWYNK